MEAIINTGGVGYLRLQNLGAFRRVWGGRYILAWQVEKRRDDREASQTSVTCNTRDFNLAA